jgi:hypothetical protein
MTNLPSFRMNAHAAVRNRYVVADRHRGHHNEHEH